MEFGKRHGSRDFSVVTDLLRGIYGETGVMDFGKTLLRGSCGLAMGKSPTCYRLVTDIIYVADLLVTQLGSRQLVTDLLRGNWCNGLWPLILGRMTFFPCEQMSLMLLHVGVMLYGRWFSGTMGSQCLPVR